MNQRSEQQRDSLTELSSSFSWIRLSSKSCSRVSVSPLRGGRPSRTTEREEEEEPEGRGEEGLGWEEGGGAGGEEIQGWAVTKEREGWRTKGRGDAEETLILSETHQEGKFMNDIIWHQEWQCDVSRTEALTSDLVWGYAQSRDWLLIYWGSGLCSLSYEVTGSLQQECVWQNSSIGTIPFRMMSGQHTSCLLYDPVDHQSSPHFLPFTQSLVSDNSVKVLLQRNLHTRQSVFIEVKVHISVSPLQPAFVCEPCLSVTADWGSAELEPPQLHMIGWDACQSRHNEPECVWSCKSNWAQWEEFFCSLQKVWSQQHLVDIRGAAVRHNDLSEYSKSCRCNTQQTSSALRLRVRNIPHTDLCVTCHSLEQKTHRWSSQPSTDLQLMVAKVDKLQIYILEIDHYINGFNFLSPSDPQTSCQAGANILCNQLISHFIWNILTFKCFLTEVKEEVQFGTSWQHRAVMSASGAPMDSFVHADNFTGLHRDLTSLFCLNGQKFLQTTSKCYGNP